MAVSPRWGSFTKRLVRAATTPRLPQMLPLDYFFFPFGFIIEMYAAAMRSSFAP
jgi:hypothetical protein